MKRSILALIAACTTACSTTSTYRPSRLPAAELAWHFDDGLEVHRGGEKVAGEMTWSGLSDAVGCVEAAREEASTAYAQSVAGKSMLFGGAGGTLAGAGVALGGVFQEEIDTQMLLTGAVITTGAMIALVIGAFVQAGAMPNAIDAVNIYNDEHAATPGCSR